MPHILKPTLTQNNLLNICRIYVLLMSYFCLTYVVNMYYLGITYVLLISYLDLT